MITGHSSRLKWRPNAAEQTRTLTEAIDIARRWGVKIPDDVAFFIDEVGELDADTTARGPKITKPAGSTVYWRDFVHHLTGKVPFIVRPDILKSDEAIVAVVGHEMYELEVIRKLLHTDRGMSVESLKGLTDFDNPGNLHDEAWDAADDLVERMRKGEKP